MGIGSRKVLGVAVGVFLIAAGVFAPLTLAGTAAHPALTEGQLLTIALRAARVAGDPRPALIQHAEGTREQANRIASGSGVPGSAWSYLIAERGHFVFASAPRPPGAPAPRGAVMTLVVDAATGRVNDDGTSSRYPPLHQLGQVTTDLRTYAACPARARNPLTSTTSGAATELVPPGPRQVLLCRYSGLNPTPAHAGRLLAHRLVRSPRTISQLTARFDALRPFGSGAYSCPVDFGVTIIAFFRYLPTPESDDPVSVDPGGCTPVTNGRITRTAMFPPGSALIAQLNREVG
jgi:hypothetical protein